MPKLTHEEANRQILEVLGVKDQKVEPQKALLDVLRGRNEKELGSKVSDNGRPAGGAERDGGGRMAEVFNRKAMGL